MASLASHGYRTIGVAVARNDDDWNFLEFRRFSTRRDLIQRDHASPGLALTA